MNQERFSREQIVAIRRRLQAWFKVNRRLLPWRRNRDPYAIWISEVMLQQTQVAAVIPYYLRFMERFPTVIALAEASEQDVLRLWEGLGYYRRARQLHAAARVIVRDHSGDFPHEEELAAALPGLGRYTVGAVLSQAFDRRLPVVEANVARALCRLGAWQGELHQRQTQEWLWRTAEALLPRSGVGDFNQALMELGQTVCVARQPVCLLCPLRELCRGSAEGIAESLPRRGQKQPLVESHEVAVILVKADRILLAQRRPDAARWASMWEFPTCTVEGSRDVRARASELLRHLTGSRGRVLANLGAIRYGVTRFRITLHAVSAEITRGSARSDHHQSQRWLRADELAEFPLSVPQRRLAKLWMESRKPVHR